jgi:hypothetical protein
MWSDWNISERTFDVTFDDDGAAAGLAYAMEDAVEFGIYDCCVWRRYEVVNGLVFWVGEVVNTSPSSIVLWHQS